MYVGLQPMRLISFDPLRTWGIPGTRPVKADRWQEELDVIRAADWVLFPEYWQVNFLTYGLKVRVFPSVSSYHLGHNKVEMTRAFEVVAGEHVPYTRILPRTDNAVEAILDDFPLPFVAKEIHNSMGRGVFLIEERAELEQYVAANHMLYLQEQLPIDRDVRVVIVGEQVVAAYWRIAPAGGFYTNVARGGEISFDDVPAAAVALAQRVAAELGVNHAGFDVAVVDGRPYLLEFNVRFGNEALRGQGIRLGPLIHDYLRAQSRPA